MALQDRLDAFKANFQKQAPADAQAVMAQATDDLRASGILERTIQVGDRVPDFALENQNGETVTLAALRERGPVVVSFFRGIWCPYCNLEVAALAQARDAIEAAGASLVVVAPQLPEHARATFEKHGGKVDVLVDAGNDFARQLGLVFALPAALREVYTAFDILLPRFNGDESWELPMPARLVIDADGILVDADINPDYTVRPDPAETVAAVKRLTAAA
ncbi:MAG: peroxiredoxin-like family protein [Pseudomonadota bacterium]